MKKQKISDAVIHRLPRYYRYLDDLYIKGVLRISSSSLGDKMDITASQIRQDLSCFGEFGQQGYGYNVAELRNSIASILGTDRGYRAILIGVGHIGHALMDNFCFSEWGFNLVRAFDVNPEIIGQEFGGVQVSNMNDLVSFLGDNTVDVAVLTVPREAAVPVAKLLTENGIRAIWNFTNVELTEPDTDIIVENLHFSDSLLSLSYFISEANDEKRPAE